MKMFAKLSFAPSLSALVLAAAVAGSGCCPAKTVVETPKVVAPPDQDGDGIADADDRCGDHARQTDIGDDDRRSRIAAVQPVGDQARRDAVGSGHQREEASEEQEQREKGVETEGHERFPWAAASLATAWPVSQLPHDIHAPGISTSIALAETRATTGWREEVQ